MSFRLSWDLLNLLPAPGKSISHVRLVQLLEHEHRGDELPESFARKVLNNLQNLAYVIEQVKSQAVLRFYDVCRVRTEFQHGNS